MRLGGTKEKKLGSMNIRCFIFSNSTTAKNENHVKNGSTRNEVWKWKKDATTRNTFGVRGLFHSE